MSLKPVASEKALAIATGVDMQFPSPNPFDPRGVKGLGVSIWIISGLFTSTLVGKR